MVVAVLRKFWLMKKKLPNHHLHKYGKCCVTSERRNVHFGKIRAYLSTWCFITSWHSQEYFFKERLIAPASTYRTIFWNLQLYKNDLLDIQMQVLWSTNCGFYKEVKQFEHFFWCSLNKILIGNAMTLINRNVCKRTECKLNDRCVGI